MRVARGARWSSWLARVLLQALLAWELAAAQEEVYELNASLINGVALPEDHEMHGSDFVRLVEFELGPEEGRLVEFAQQGDTDQFYRIFELKGRYGPYDFGCNGASTVKVSEAFDGKAMHDVYGHIYEERDAGVDDLAESVLDTFTSKHHRGITYTQNSLFKEKQLYHVCNSDTNDGYLLGWEGFNITFGAWFHNTCTASVTVTFLVEQIDPTASGYSTSEAKQLDELQDTCKRLRALEDARFAKDVAFILLMVTIVLVFIIALSLLLPCGPLRLYVKRVYKRTADTGGHVSDLITRAEGNDRWLTIHICCACVMWLYLIMVMPRTKIVDGFDKELAGVFEFNSPNFFEALQDGTKKIDYYITVFLYALVIGCCAAGAILINFIYVGDKLHKLKKAIGIIFLICLNAMILTQAAESFSQFEWWNERGRSISLHILVWWHLLWADIKVVVLLITGNSRIECLSLGRVNRVGLHSPLGRKPLADPEVVSESSSLTTPERDDPMRAGPRKESGKGEAEDTLITVEGDDVVKNEEHRLEAKRKHAVTLLTNMRNNVWEQPGFSYVSWFLIGVICACHLTTVNYISAVVNVHEQVECLEDIYDCNNAVNKLVNNTASTMEQSIDVVNGLRQGLDDKTMLILDGARSDIMENLRVICTGGIAELGDLPSGVATWLDPGLNEEGLGVSDGLGVLPNILPLEDMEEQIAELPLAQLWAAEDDAWIQANIPWLAEFTTYRRYNDLEHSLAAHCQASQDVAAIFDQAIAESINESAERNELNGWWLMPQLLSRTDQCFLGMAYETSAACTTGRNWNTTMTSLVLQTQVEPVFAWMAEEDNKSKRNMKTATVDTPEEFEQRKAGWMKYLTDAENARQKDGTELETTWEQLFVASFTFEQLSEMFALTGCGVDDGEGYDDATYMGCIRDFLRIFDTGPLAPAAQTFFLGLQNNYDWISTVLDRLGIELYSIGVFTDELVESAERVVDFRDDLKDFFQEVGRGWRAGSYIGNTVGLFLVLINMYSMVASFKRHLISIHLERLMPRILTANHKSLHGFNFGPASDTLAQYQFGTAGFFVAFLASASAIQMKITGMIMTVVFAVISTEVFWTEVVVRIWKWVLALVFSIVLTMLLGKVLGNMVFGNGKRIKQPAGYLGFHIITTLFKLVVGSALAILRLVYTVIAAFLVVMRVDKCLFPLPVFMSGKDAGHNCFMQIANFSRALLDLEDHLAMCPARRRWKTAIEGVVIKLRTVDGRWDSAKLGWNDDDSAADEKPDPNKKLVKVGSKEAV